MTTQTILKEGIFKESQDKGKEYLLYLNVDRLIAPCYEAAGKQPKAPRYGGWESTEIAGHSIGHWLSAAAVMYCATKEQGLLEKIKYALDELEKVQCFDPDRYLSGFPRDCFDEVFSGEFEVGRFSLGDSWVPWYSIHKIFAGLIDVYQMLRIEKALTIVTKLADWAVKGLSRLNDEQFSRMLYCEHGGMNEAMADLYLLTQNEDYLTLAKRFCDEEVFEPLSKSIDCLEGMHANTQIPKVIGAAKLYEITGEKHYKDIAVFFWDQVVNYRSYVLGGNSHREHFGPVNDEELGIQTMETCNTYNMLKLTEHLFRWTPNVKFMDYYERALYNHILASQDPKTGMKSYFIPTEPGHFKIYCSPDNSFWCCTGTGMENPARYTRNIYHQSEDGIYVNLFIASEVRFSDKGLSLSQKTRFPESDQSTIVMQEVTSFENFTIHIRVPHWLNGALKVVVNEEEVYEQKENGYLSIKRVWKAGDTINIELPMSIHKYIAKDDPHKQALLYGPLVLAGRLGRENYPESDLLDDHMALDNHPLIEVPILVTDEEDPNLWIDQTNDSPLSFQTKEMAQPDHQSMTLVPFYDLHHERYTIYWNVMNQKKYEHFQEEKQMQLKRKREITVDEIFPNEQQPEVEHQLKAKNSHSGYLNTVQKGWRDCRDDGYFSYEMKVLPDRKMYLFVEYFGKDSDIYVDGKHYKRKFLILIEDTVIAEQTLKGDQTDELFEVIYEIPEELTANKESIRVTFKSEEGKIAGGVFGVRMTHARE